MKSRTHLALVMAMIVCGCGGGGGGTSGGGGGGYTTLFEDDFAAFPSAKWAVSGLGTATHDPVLGAPDAGSVELVANTTIAAVTTAFPIDGGLEIYVRVRLPDNSVVPSLDIHRLIEIQNVGSGGHAWLDLYRTSCGGSISTQLQYGTTNTGLALAEDFNCSSAPSSRFIDFAFIVYADGTAAWARDGNVVVHPTIPFGTGSLRLLLHGGDEGFGDPNWSVWYDDVLVAKPN